MRLLTIGDIHGCHAALTALLQHVQPQPEDKLVFLGDYIDRGPASRAVVDALLQLEQICLPVFLRGNHEAMVLEAREDEMKSNLWQSYGGLETLYSYGAAYRQDWPVAIPAAHWRFFENTTRFYENETHVFVHACLDPDLDMQEQPDWLLFWEFFEKMQPHKSGKKVICGHTVQPSGQIADVGFAACIDTGPATGGWLTCLDVISGKYWQANENGKTQTGKLADNNSS
jgi:serine/threonine protein phosphatase 1